MASFNETWEFWKYKWARAWQNQQKLPVRPAKTQISLAFRPVWPEPSLFAWMKFGPLPTHKVPHNEDSAQTGWTCVFAGRTSHFVGFVML